VTAQQAGVTLIKGALESPIDRLEYGRVFEALAAERVQALVVGGAGENLTNRRLIIELAARAKLPTMYPWREFVSDGGLIGLAADLADAYRHMGRQVSEKLQGGKAGEIPFYQTSVHNLVRRVGRWSCTTSLSQN
jgi:putative ABC transport system substrate-binding protein